MKEQLGNMKDVRDRFSKRLHIQIYIEDSECIVSESCGLREVKETADRVRKEMKEAGVEGEPIARLAICDGDRLMEIFGVAAEACISL